MNRQYAVLPREQRTKNLYDEALQELEAVLAAGHGRAWDNIQIEQLASAIKLMKDRVRRADGDVRSARLIALLLLQTPRAARAQDIMDRRHGHSYHHRHKRLYELIDFNDTFVDIILSLSHEERLRFERRAYELMRQMCRRARTHMFSEGQYDAIIHGLSRETAVYLGARAEGYDVHMTSRVADGLGVDMQIRERTSGRYINIDCKTTGAYLRRVETLRREGRLSEHEVGLALTRGFVEVVNGHGANQVKVVLFAIVTDVLGEIRAFEFTQTDILALKLDEAIAVYGRKDDGFYRYEDAND